MPIHPNTQAMASSSNCNTNLGQTGPIHAMVNDMLILSKQD